MSRPPYVLLIIFGGTDDIVATEPQGIYREYFPLEVPNSPLGGGGGDGGGGKDD